MIPTYTPIALLDGAAPALGCDLERATTTAMPALIAIFLYAVRLVRRPIDGRLKEARVGTLTVATVGVGLVMSWNLLRPRDLGNTYFVGEVAGVAAVYLMTCTLLLASRLKWLEQWFGGLDGMYYWHKQYALWAVPLLIVHVFGTQQGSGAIEIRDADGPGAGEILGVISIVGLLLLILISLPRVGRIARLPYERWLLLHRLIGLFVLLALVHGWMLDPVLDRSTPLRVAYVLIGTVGLAAYGYDELLRRHVEPIAEYIVHDVKCPVPGTIDVTLAPIAGSSALPVAAGQFVYLRLGGTQAWREHPFSVAGTNADGAVRLTIRALGRDTRRLYAELRSGTPATLSGPYGMFDLTLGGPHQLWIAGGIGIAPFLGWITHQREPLPKVDLFFSAASADEMPFLAEISEAAEQNPISASTPTSAEVRAVSLRTGSAPLSADSPATPMCSSAALRR